MTVVAFELDLERPFALDPQIYTNEVCLAAMQQVRRTDSTTGEAVDDQIVPPTIHPRIARRIVEVGLEEGIDFGTTIDLPTERDDYPFDVILHHDHGGQSTIVLTGLAARRTYSALRNAYDDLHH